MTILTVPLVVAPSQTLTVQLGQQACRLNVRQRRTGLFVDLYVQDAPIVLGVKALDRVKMVRGEYLGFAGQLFFVDTQGHDAPDYSGFGSSPRWLLLYETI